MPSNYTVEPAKLYLSDSFEVLETHFSGDLIGQANDLVADKVSVAWDIIYASTEPLSQSYAVDGTSVTATYAANPTAEWAGAARVVINGTSLSDDPNDFTWSMSSIEVFLTSSEAPDDWANPLAYVSIGLNAAFDGVTPAEQVDVSINHLIVEAGDMRVAFTGPITLDASAQTIGMTTGKLEIQYDTDPTASVNLANIYLDVSGLSLNGATDQAAGTVNGFGFYKGASLASASHYFYGEDLNVSLAVLDALPDGATNTELLRAVFQGNNDTVYTATDLEIPEGFENVVIGGTGDVAIDANGLDNLITGNAGDNEVDGGAGTDTFETQGTFAGSAGVLNRDGSITVTTAAGGSDTLTDVEFVQFDSGSPYSVRQTIDSAEQTYTVNPSETFSITLPELKSGDGVLDFAPTQTSWITPKGIVLADGDYLFVKNIRTIETDITTQFLNTYTPSLLDGGVSDGTGDHNVGVVPPAGSNLLTAGSFTGLPTGNEARTYSAWIKLDPGEGGTVLEHGSINPSTFYHRVALNVVPEGGASKLVLDFQVGSFGTTTSHSINDGLWHHIVATVDPSAGTYAFYIDGAPKAVAPSGGFTPTSIDTINVPNEGLLIGYGHGVDAGRTDPSEVIPGSVFSGEIANVSVFKQSLSQPTVDNLYSSVIPTGSLNPSITALSGTTPVPSDIYSIELTRTDSDGQLDTSFGTEGRLLITPGFAGSAALAESASGDILFAQSVSYNYINGAGNIPNTGTKLFKFSPSGVIEESGWVTGGSHAVSKIISGPNGEVYLIGTAGGGGNVEILKVGADFAKTGDYFSFTKILSRDVAGLHGNSSPNDYVQDAGVDSAGNFYILSDGSGLGAYLTKVFATGVVDSAWATSGTEDMLLSSINYTSNIVNWNGESTVFSGGPSSDLITAVNHHSSSSMIISSGAGDDYLQWRGGYEITFNGGDGFDTLDLNNTVSRVVVTDESSGSGFVEYPFGSPIVYKQAFFTGIEAITYRDEPDSSWDLGGLQFYRTGVDSASILGSKVLGIETSQKPLGLSVQADGSVFVAYYTSVYTGSGQPNGSSATIEVAKFLANGSYDSSFGGGDGRAVIEMSGDSSWTSEGAQLLTIDSDGRPVLAFQRFWGTEVIRLTADGTVDEIFTAPASSLGSPPDSGADPILDIAPGSMDQPMWVQVDVQDNILVGVQDWANVGGISSSTYAVAKFIDEGGLDYIYAFLEFISDNQEAFPNKYEFENLYGHGVCERLTGRLETSDWRDFTWDVGTRDTSVRIPISVFEAKCGYFEDRRPAANVNPYIISWNMFNWVLRFENLVYAANVERRNRAQVAKDAKDAVAKACENQTNAAQPSDEFTPEEEIASEESESEDEQPKSIAGKVLNALGF